MSQKFSLSKKLKQNETRNKDQGEVVQGSGNRAALQIPFQSAELLRTFKYWLLGLDVSKHAVSLHLCHSLYFSLFLLFCFPSVSPSCSIRLTYKNGEEVKVSQGTFSILLILQFFPGWFDKIAVPSAIDGLSQAKLSHLWQKQDT